MCTLLQGHGTLLRSPEKRVVSRTISCAMRATDEHLRGEHSSVAVQRQHSTPSQEHCQISMHMHVDHHEHGAFAT